MRNAVRSLREGSATLFASVSVALVILLSGLTGCSLGSPPAVDAPMAQAADVVGEIRVILENRAEAVSSGNLADFLVGVDQDDEEFIADQKQYFTNLAQLPLAAFGYEIPEGASASTADGIVRLSLVERLQLDGYDAVPVRTPARYSFVRDPAGAIVLAATRDPEWEKANDVDLAPWDLMAIRAEESSGVLGIFDDGSIDTAGQIMDAVERGVGQVQSEIPFDWDGRVVVYALSSIEILASLDNLPGGDADALDGVAFPVWAGPQSRTLASTRFMIHPRMIERDESIRDRLVRHELTHVAMGPRDDSVPIWLSEGLAEYISVQSVPGFERLISRDALAAARTGLVDLPEDRTFNGIRSSSNYGIAWYACEYIVGAYGEKTLWRLFDEMRAGNGTESAEQDGVLDRVLGLGSRDLARATGRKIVATFG